MLSPSNNERRMLPIFADASKLQTCVKHMFFPVMGQPNGGSMRIFLYAAKQSPSQVRFTNDLYGLVSSHEMIVLPEGCKFTSPLCFKMRSGDLLILFAANKAELEELLQLEDEYESFRIILVLGEYNEETEKLVQPLRPCFVSSSESPLDGIRDVIEKISSNNNS